MKVINWLIAAALVSIAVSSIGRADDEEMCPGKIKGYLCMSGTAAIGVLGSGSVTTEVGFSDGLKGSMLGLTLSTMLPIATSQDLTDLTLSREENDQVVFAQADAKEYLLGKTSYDSHSVLGEATDTVYGIIASRTSVNPNVFSKEQIALAIYLHGTAGSR